MRKVFKRKLRSCPHCNPNKTGGAIRWSAKQFYALKADEKEIRDALTNEW